MVIYSDSINKCGFKTCLNHRVDSFYAKYRDSESLESFFKNVDFAQNAIFGSFYLHPFYVNLLFRFLVPKIPLAPGGVTARYSSCPPGRGGGHFSMNFVKPPPQRTKNKIVRFDSKIVSDHVKHYPGSQEHVSHRHQPFSSQKDSFGKVISLVYSDLYPPPLSGRGRGQR